MKVRYLAVLAFIISFTLVSIPTVKLHNEPKYFYRYFGKTPVIWKPGLTFCINFSNPPTNLNSTFKKKLFTEFKTLSTFVATDRCRQQNLEVDFAPREKLSFLKSNIALAAATPTYDESDPRFIVGGLIQVDAKAFKKLDNKTAINLLLHEMGHVLGLTHTSDGSLMVPIISDVKESKYPREGILDLISRERFLK